MDARPAALAAAFPRARGLTLIEILIALLVLSIGLLGLAGLQTASLKFNASSYHRTQATALAYEMADRMRANRQAALSNAYNTGFGQVQQCANIDPDGTVPEQHLALWRNELACRLPQSTGAIERIGGDRFRLTVRWTDDPEGGNPMEFQFTTAL